MALRAFALKIVVASTALAAVVAASAVWVVLTDPVAVIRVVAGDRGLDARDIAWLVGAAVRGALRWL